MISSSRVHVGLVISVSPDFFARRILQLLTQLYGPHVQVRADVEPSRAASSLGLERLPHICWAHRKRKLQDAPIAELETLSFSGRLRPY
jgi:hypothetical protein